MCPHLYKGDPPNFSFLTSSPAIQLLERESECAALGALISGAAARGGDLVVLDGPSGVGKSALLRWLSERCEARVEFSATCPADYAVPRGN